MARVWEYGGGRNTDRFPYRVLRLAGWALLILAVIIFILGIVDVGWTAGNYTRNSCNTLNWNERLTKPCTDKTEVDELIWTWVAAPIWASFFIIITGIVGTRFSSWNNSNIRFHRDMFTVLCVLVCLLWGPAIIVLCALEVYYGNDIFYYTDNGKMEMQDTAKFVLPIMIALITFFTWIAAIVGVCVGCCCAPVQDVDEYGSIRRLRPSSEIDVYRSRDKHYDSFPRRSRSMRSAPTRDMIPYGGNVMGPPIFMPPTGGYSGGSSYPQPQMAAALPSAGYGGASYPQTQMAAALPSAGYGGYASPYGYYGGAYGGANYGASATAAYSSPYASYGGYGRAASASPYF